MIKKVGEHNLVKQRSFCGSYLAFWGQNGNIEALACGRIVWGSIQLYKALRMVGAIQSISLLPEVFYQPNFFIRLFFGRNYSDFSNSFFISSLIIIVAISGVLSVLGYKTNKSIFVFSFLQFFLACFSYSFGDYHHDKAVPIVIGLLLSLTPCGARFSVDALLNIQISLLALRRQNFGWFFQFIKCFLTIVYFSAGSSKLLHSGRDWLSGSALIYYIQQDASENARPIGLWLCQYLNFCVCLSWIVLGFQLLFGLGIFKKKYQTLTVVTAILFHFATDLLMRANFIGFIGVLSFLLPWQRFVSFFSFEILKKKQTY